MTALLPRSGSYASQSSSGAPLVVNGQVDMAAVRLLAAFDDVTLEMTPWAQDVNGLPCADAPALLRAMNPNIRLWLYALAGDQWLPPTFVPSPTDHSAFRYIFDAVNAGNGWLYDTAGAQWFENYRVNLADAATVERMGDLYVRLVKVMRPDGIFLDDAHTSIAWTSKPDRPLDVGRAGFPTLAAMDSARLANIEGLIARLHAASPCLLVAVNGTGPTPAGTDVTFREGLGSLISHNDARRWLRTPGKHWLKGETSGGVPTCAQMRVLMRSLAAGTDAIISAGPDRGWPPCATYPEKGE